METKKKILIVEDEKNIAQVLQYNIIKSGYEAEIAGDGGTGLVRALSGEFDLVLLDIMLPGADGYDIFEYIKPLKIPVIFITAKHEVKDRVKGLKMGAEDYLVKPFGVMEMVARVNAVLRRMAKDLRAWLLYTRHRFSDNIATSHRCDIDLSRAFRDSSFASSRKDPRYCALAYSIQ